MLCLGDLRGGLSCFHEGRAVGQLRKILGVPKCDGNVLAQLGAPGRRLEGVI